MDEYTEGFSEMSDQQVMEFMGDQTKFYIVGMMIPYRPGVHLHASLLEYRHYPPKDPRNALFELGIISWAEIKWSVVRIPLKDKSYAEEILKEVGLKFVEAIPITFEDGIEEYFPVPVENLENVVTLESVRDHLIYLNDPTVNKMIFQLEMLLSEKIYNGDIGPVDFNMILEEMHAASERTRDAGSENPSG